VHQFSGNVAQSYGGDPMNIDQDYLNVKLSRSDPASAANDTSTADLFCRRTGGRLGCAVMGCPGLPGSRRADRGRSRQLPMTLEGLRHWIVGSMASARTRCAYRLVISNSDSISVSDSRCGSSPSPTSPVCTTL
jgi:hypothetical protein